MAIERDEFAEECVHQGLRFGIHPHYLLACAQLRSGISDNTDGDRIGPFRLTQAEWNANCFDEDFGIRTFKPGDISGPLGPEFQICIYALMALKAQFRCLDRLGQLPTAADLYREQWPNEAAKLPGSLEAALTATADLMPDALEAVPDAPQDPVTIKAGDFTPNPPVSLDKPVKKGTETFVAKVPGIMAKLIADFDLKDFQAAGIMGNIGLECDGFREMQEKKPIVPGSKGGFGWAQWTGSRRVLFESFCSTNGLDPFSDAANYGFLRTELKGSQKASITALLNTAKIADAVRVFEQTFEKAKAGLEHFDRRDEWSVLALNTFRAHQDTVVPADVTRLLDPNLNHQVVARAILGNAVFFVVEQFGDDGGQALVKAETGKPAAVLISDTSIFPLPAGLVPPTVLAQLSATFNGTVSPDVPAPANLPAAASADEVSQRLLAMAKQCNGTLITRDAPNTNHGRVACAFAVNAVATKALGHPIGGGLSTAAMGDILARNQTLVPETEIRAGLIIISPTHGSNVGHVGIVGDIKDPVSSTTIYSNSSKMGVFSDQFKFGRWKNFYRDNKGLPVLLYSIKA